MHRFAPAALLAVSFILSGCAVATAGKSFNVDKVRELRNGSTTFAQALQLMGAPPERSDATTYGSVNHVWLFVETKAGAFSFDTRKWTFTAEFTKEGVFQRLVAVSGIEMSAEDRARLFTAAPAR